MRWSADIRRSRRLGARSVIPVSISGTAEKHGVFSLEGHRRAYRRAGSADPLRRQEAMESAVWTNIEDLPANELRKRSPRVVVDLIVPQVPL